LRLPLRTRKAMPLPTPLARRWVASVDYECPPAGGSLANVSSHVAIPLIQRQLRGGGGGEFEGSN